MEKFAFSLNGTEVPAPTGIAHLSGGLLGSGTQIIQTIIIFAFLAGIVIALAYIAHAGISIILSGGDKEKLQKARQKVVYSIVGLIIMFLSFTIIGIVEAFFGIKLLQFGVLP